VLIWDGSDLRYGDLLEDEERLAGKSGPRVNSLYAEGNIVWVGTSSGLMQYIDGTRAFSWQEPLQSISSFYSSSIGVIYPSPDDEGLLVGIGSELFKFDGEKFNLVLQLSSEIRSIYAGPYQIWLATSTSGLYSVVMDNSLGIYWDLVSKNNQLSDQFGYQSIIMTDPHTLWVGSLDNGLVRIRGMFSQ
jgi:ligand-binding sensor domain-containing protein